MIFVAGYQEEKEVSHDAFMHAFEAAKPAARIPGLQQFAAAVSSAICLHTSGF
jgi:hypothetical protein